MSNLTMKIHLRRTGGFAGLDENLGTADTALLSEGAAEQLCRQVEQLFAVAATTTVTLGADYLRYEIRVSDGTTLRSLTIDDTGEPNNQPMELIRAIQEHLR